MELSFDTSGDSFPLAKMGTVIKKCHIFVITLTKGNMKCLPFGEMLALKVDAENVNLFLTNLYVIYKN